MGTDHNPRSRRKTSRRDFLKRSAGVMAAGAVGGGLDVARGAHVAIDETIKVGVVGCGGRGTGAAWQAICAGGPVKLVAMGDMFAHRLLRCRLEYADQREVVLRWKRAPSLRPSSPAAEIKR